MKRLSAVWKMNGIYDGSSLDGCYSGEAVTDSNEAQPLGVTLMLIQA